MNTSTSFRLIFCIHVVLTHLVDFRFNQPQYFLIRCLEMYIIFTSSGSASIYIYIYIYIWEWRWVPCAPGKEKIYKKKVKVLSVGATAWF